MRVLVVGSGGREHALCWAISSSPLCDALFCAPGNPGIADEAACVDVQAGDTDGILKLCKKEKIDFVVVGPEGPLVAGLVDRLESAGIAAFGPSAAAAGDGFVYIAGTNGALYGLHLADNSMRLLMQSPVSGEFEGLDFHGPQLRWLVNRSDGPHILYSYAPVYAAASTP